jgi:hypothetical protein
MAHSDSAARMGARGALGVKIGSPLCRQNARITKTFSLYANDLGESALHVEFTISLLIALLALVSVFIEIPFVSNYAFWVLLGAYILLAGRK